MTPSRWLLLSALLTAACSAAPPSSPASPPAPAPAPSAAAPEPSATAATTASPGWQSFDARVVRCGIDDAPRSVVGAAQDGALPGESGLLSGPEEGSDGLAIFIESGRAPQKPLPVLRIDRAFPAGEAPVRVPRSPPIFVERLPMLLGNGEPLPPSVGQALASSQPAFEICNNLAQELPISPSFQLELAASGAPLRVLPTHDGAVSNHERCLMEQVCQINARSTRLTNATLVRVPLRVSREMPRPTPPPGVEARVDVMTENPSDTSSEFQLKLRTSVADAARRCGAVQGRARVRFSLDMVTIGQGGDRKRRITAATPPRTSVSQVRTEALAGVVAPSVLSCIVNAQMSFSLFDGSAAPQRTERVVVTWNP